VVTLQLDQFVSSCRCCLEMLSTPAPFVYGGCFSDYVKEKRKFSRFSTLARFSAAATSSCSEGSTRDESEAEECEIQRLFAEARLQDIGTVSSIELPDFISKVVNLADIVQYIREQRGELLEEDDEDWGCEEDLEEEEGLAEPFGSSFITKGELEVAKPVVYEGSFADYKKDGAKFTRFRTLRAFCTEIDDHCAMAEAPAEAPMVMSLPADASLSMPSLFDSTIEVDDSVKEGQFVMLSKCSSPCYAVALATPPSMSGGMSMYVGLSDSSVQTACSSSMGGGSAAVRQKSALSSASHP